MGATYGERGQTRPMPRYIQVFQDAALGETPAIRRSTRGELIRLVRAHTRSNLYDESNATPDKLAIYSLSDPRDIRDVRYIGQTRAPRSRFLQHVNATRLWLPEVLPWWIKSPQLRPLYSWMRALYFAEQRLPVMLITAWAASVKEARCAERDRIIKCLTQGHDLCNVEKATLGPRLLLL
jgi:hypothetical protein